MTVTPASLIATYPEWTAVNTSFPAVVIAAIAFGVGSVDEAVIGAELFDHAVMLAAGAWLYDHPYGRDMHKPDDGSESPYRRQLAELMRRKGSAYRTVWSEADFTGSS